MNKKEREIFIELYRYLQDNRNAHPVIYFSQDVLGSVLRKELGIAKRLIELKTRRDQ